VIEGRVLVDGRIHADGQRKEYDHYLTSQHQQQGIRQPLGDDLAHRPPLHKRVTPISAQDALPCTLGLGHAVAVHVYVHPVIPYQPDGVLHQDRLVEAQLASQPFAIRRTYSAAAAKRGQGISHGIRQGEQDDTDDQQQ
jgi:hypothetical protein